MSQRTGQSRRAKTGALQAPVEAEHLAQPDDQGLSLEDLGQAYAALLNKGADPYAEEGGSRESRAPPRSGGRGSQGSGDRGQETADTEEEVTPVLRGADEAACEVTPQSILEAMLFVGHPTGEPMTSERIAGLMRGVRPAEIDDLVRQLNEEYEAEGAPYAILSAGA